MTDMLVNLYTLSEEPLINSHYTIRKVVPPEKRKVVEWVKQHFSAGWADECEVACSLSPANCFIAVDNNNEILGFACYDTTFRNFFGPTGVKESARAQGIGFQLLRYSLLEMRHMGYGYAIIGDAGPAAFYEKAVGAIPIIGQPVLNQIMEKNP